MRALNDRTIIDPPEALHPIQEESRSLGFRLASEPMTGSLLRALAASKPGGLLLELGTGTGVGTSWLLAGMTPDARLVTVDNDPAVMDVARRHLSGDERVAFHLDLTAQKPFHIRSGLTAPADKPNQKVYKLLSKTGTEPPAFRCGSA